MKKINFILFLHLLIGNLTYCQTTFFGVIKDAKNNPISNASIIIKSTNPEIIIEYCYSDETGHYKLKINKKGNFTLVFSAFSYESVYEEIELTDESNIMEKNITLTYKPIELNEVFIKTERPITVKKDTITFLAKSFIQGNEKVVQDLLKKIPGLNVTDDGTIKVGNQEVEKVMIEGDDFFEKGYKLVTKNMPANPIEKVELYQNYSNNKHLKGIEKSNKVALNLKLKPDAKRQWFGNIESGYGLISENRYDLQANLMNFGKKNKFYIITNLNNIGDDTTGSINQLIRPYNSEGSENPGDNENAFSLIDLPSDTPNLKQKWVNFNNAEMLSLSSIFTLSSKTKLKTIGFFNSDENNFFRNSFQVYNVGNTYFENYEEFQERKKRITGFGKIDLTYDISSSKTIEYTMKFNATNENNISNINFNNDLLNEKLNSRNELFDQKLVFTNKFKSKKVLIFCGRFINEKTPQNYKANQFLYQELFNQDGDNIIQKSQNKMEFIGFNARLLDRKKEGTLFELEVGNKLRRDNLITNFQLVESNNTIAEPLGYQNQFLYTNDDLYLSSKYLLKVKKVNFILQSDLHQLFNTIESYDNSKNQNPFFINPKINFEWNINKKNKLLTSYSFNKTNATAVETFDHYVQTGFRYFSKGTGNFNQLDASSASLSYTYGSWEDIFFANLLVMYTKNHDFFSTNTLVSQNYSQSETMVINGREFVTISSNIDRFFKSISTNLKFIFNATKSNYKNIVNNSELREIKSTTLNYGVELRSGFKGIFNYHIGSKWNYTEVKTTFYNSFIDNTSFLDLSFVMNDKLNFQIQAERYYFGNIEKQNNRYYFMDLEARYTLKENKLSFSVSGNNLFNNTTFKNYNLSDISSSKTEYRLQPRYVLLKTEFRF